MQFIESVLQSMSAARLAGSTYGDVLFTLIVEEGRPCGGLITRHWPRREIAKTQGLASLSRSEMAIIALAIRLSYVFACGTIWSARISDP